MDTERLTTGYREGLSNGDIGFSLLMNKAILSKSSAACKTYGKIEALQQAIDEHVVFQSDPLAMTRSVRFCLWLNEALHAFGAFVWFKGNSPNRTEYLFPEAAYQFITQEIEWYKLRAGSISDFIHSYRPICVSVNKLRIATRELESQFIEWWESPEITKELRLHPDLADCYINQCRFLNRLSSYFFWLGQFYRATYSSNTGESSSKDMIWSGTMPKFQLDEEVLS